MVDKDVLDFDPTFFGIATRDAEKLDPQQRLVMATTWEALENAGITQEQVRGSKTAVFIGSFNMDNTIRLSEDITNITSTTAFSDTTFLSARASHFLDLHGPCATVNTACSSSLAAIDVAGTYLLSGRCSMAIAGGVNVILHPQLIIVCKGCGREV